jgi:hypothetical protein
MLDYIHNIFLLYCQDNPLKRYIACLFYDIIFFFYFVSVTP